MKGRKLEIKSLFIAQEVWSIQRENFGGANFPDCPRLYKLSKIDTFCTIKKLYFSRTCTHNSTKDPGQEPFSFNVGLGKVIKGK